VKPVVVGITGMGVLSPYGAGCGALIDGLLGGSAAGRAKRLQGWPDPQTGLTIAGIDDRDVAAVLGDERRRGLNPETSVLLAAARMAIADAGLEHVRGAGTGIAVSTRHAGLQDYAELFWAGVGGQAGAVSPARGPQTGFNAPAAQLSIRLGARGPNMTMSNGSVGGLDALSYAVDALRAGSAEVMLVGGIELAPRVAGGLLARQATTATTRPRPYDRGRSGPLLGEAGIVVVLESRAHARRRGSGIRVEVGAVTSAFAPRNDLLGASRRTLVGALDACSTDRGEVAAIFSGANGSVGGDATDAHALHELFGDRVAVCAIKGATGDGAGAGALTQVVVATLGMERQTIPPTVGFRSPDPALPALGVSTSARELARGPIVVHTWEEPCCAASALLHDCAPTRRHTRMSAQTRPTGAA
jgi:3-oxoacyl-[acyl-carrier-protein] synthase II